jgi:hypothetical protein
MPVEIRDIVVIENSISCQLVEGRCLGTECREAFGVVVDLTPIGHGKEEQNEKGRYHHDNDPLGFPHVAKDDGVRLKASEMVSRKQ